MTIDDYCISLNLNNFFLVVLGVVDMYHNLLSVRSRFSGENLMHFTVLSLFKLFACSKSFNVLLLTNMEKKSSESPDHDLHLCSRFSPLSRC